MVPTRFNWIVRLAGALRALGPYAAIELLVPGGTLIALAVWAFRNRQSLAARARRARASVKASDLPDASIDLAADDVHDGTTAPLATIR
jgi:hypothetical protein